MLALARVPRPLAAVAATALDTWDVAEIMPFWAAVLGLRRGKAPRFVKRYADLAGVIERLWRAGYTVIGPTISQQAIVFDELRSIEQLLERMMESNENIAQRWDQAWQLYEDMRKNQTK